MEIIHIILGKANPERMNGVNKVVYQLASNQHKYKKEVSVWGITKDISKNYGERNFKTRLFKKALNPFKPNKELLEAILSKKDSAIFHIHGGWIPVFYAISKFLHHNKIPYVFTPHGAYNTIAMKRSALLKKVYFILFEKKIIVRARKIHCIGQSEIKGLNFLYKTSKTILLPYGFDMNLEKVIQNENTEELIIGFVGRLDVYTKGLDLLVDAFELFHKENVNSKLWIIGDGLDKNKLTKLIHLKGLEQSVILFGGKFGKDKDDLLNQMHVFAHPSRNEGLPSSVLEASNLGIPCIISKATNLGTFIENYECGIVVEDENTEAIKNALSKIHNLWLNKSLSKMRNNSQNMVRKAFNWSDLIEEFNQLYVR